MLSANPGKGRESVWFGGLLVPEAYLIATQQATAQLNAWSLEELELKLGFDPTEEEIQRATEEETGFILHGLSIESAEYDPKEGRIALSSKLSSALPTVNLQWVHKDPAKRRREPGQEIEVDPEPDQVVEVPVYLNRARTIVLTSIKMPAVGFPPTVWYQRGVAIFA